MQTYLTFRSLIGEHLSYTLVYLDSILSVFSYNYKLTKKSKFLSILNLFFANLLQLLFIILYYYLIHMLKQKVIFKTKDIYTSFILFLFVVMPSRKKLAVILFLLF